MLSLLLLFGCAAQQKGPGQGTGANTLVIGKDPVDVSESAETNKTQETANHFPGTSPASKDSKLKSFSISTDKPAYVSMEEIQITAKLEAQGEIPGVRVTSWGVKNAYGADAFYQNELLYLRNGENLANFTYKLPYCSLCSRLPAGIYYIYAKAEKDNKTLALANCSFNFSTG